MLFVPRLRTLLIGSVLVGGPYVALETEPGTQFVDGITRQFQITDVNANGTQLSGSHDYANHSHYEIEELRKQNVGRFRYEEEIARKLGAIPVEAEKAPTLVGATVSDLREVMRFDINPEWVFSRFSRVSTVLAELRMEGFRVPIVTGTKATDLAGTLSYYFDPNGKVQRIMLHGFTGDPSRLGETLSQHFQLQREPSLEAGVFVRRWNDRPVHFMRVTHAPVVYSNAVHQKYTVFVELNDPNLAFGISDEAKRVVDSDHYSGRW